MSELVVENWGLFERWYRYRNGQAYVLRDKPRIRKGQKVTEIDCRNVVRPEVPNRFPFGL